MTAPSRSTASARIAAGLAARPREHHGKRLADAYRFDSATERMLALRETRPEAWEALPPSVKVGAAYYAASKSAAAALGVDTSAPAATS